MRRLFGLFSLVTFCTLCSPAGWAQGRAINVKTIEWTLPDAPVVLGEIDAVTLTVVAKADDGRPLDVAPPILWTSVGHLSAPQRLEPGVFQTTFTPPPERFPHVAIVSARIERDTGLAVGFAALPLWGKGRLQVRTKPDSDVVVYLGNRSFGPVRASKDGLAAVDIITPPGPENAVAKSQDAAGNRSQKTVPLGVPSFSRMALLPIDSVAVADGTGVARLLAYAVDKKGAPLFDAQITARASVGSVDEKPRGLAPGLFRLDYHPGKSTETEARIQMHLAGSKASVAFATIRLLSGAPVPADLQLSRDTVSADDEEVVVATARFVDRAGNPSPREAFVITVDRGRIAKRVAVEREGIEVHWVVPRRVSDSPAQIIARSTTGQELGRASVRVVAGRPHRLVFDPPADVVADGQGSILLAVRAFDRVGNPVSARGGSFASDDGKVLGVSENEGAITGRFVPRPVDERRPGEVRYQLGDITTSTQVRMIPAPRARLLLGVGLRSGWNYGMLLSAGPELSTLVRLPGLLDESLYAGASLSALPAWPSVIESPGGTKLSRAHTAVPFLVEGAWRSTVGRAWVFHVGAGIGFAASDLLLSPASGTGMPQRTVSFALGGQAVLGVGYRLGPGVIEADLRAGYFVPIDPYFFGTPVGADLVVGYRLGI